MGNFYCFYSIKLGYRTNATTTEAVQAAIAASVQYKRSVRMNHRHLHTERDIADQFGCSYCSKRFSKQTYLKAHIQRRHSNDNVQNELPMELLQKMTEMKQEMGLIRNEKMEMQLKMEQTAACNQEAMNALKSQMEMFQVEQAIGKGSGNDEVLLRQLSSIEQRNANLEIKLEEARERIEELNKMNMDTASKGTMDVVQLQQIIQQLEFSISEKNDAIVRYELALSQNSGTTEKLRLSQENKIKDLTKQLQSSQKEMDRITFEVEKGQLEISRLEKVVAEKSIVVDTSSIAVQSVVTCTNAGSQCVIIEKKDQSCGTLFVHDMKDPHRKLLKEVMAEMIDSVVTSAAVDLAKHTILQPVPVAPMPKTNLPLKKVLLSSQCNVGTINVTTKMDQATLQLRNALQKEQAVKKLEALFEDIDRYSIGRNVLKFNMI